MKKGGDNSPIPMRRLRDDEDPEDEEEKEEEEETLGEAARELWASFKKLCAGLLAWLCALVGNARKAAGLDEEPELPLEVLTKEGSARFIELYPLPDHKVKLTAEERDSIERLYSFFDVNESGRITLRELQIGLTKLGNPPTREEAAKMISQLDLVRGGRRDGAIDSKEFGIGLMHRRCLLFKALYTRERMSGDGTLSDSKLEDGREPRDFVATPGEVSRTHLHDLLEKNRRKQQQKPKEQTSSRKLLGGLKKMKASSLNGSKSLLKGLTRPSISRSRSEVV